MDFKSVFSIRLFAFQPHLRSVRLVKVKGTITRNYILLIDELTHGDWKLWLVLSEKSLKQ